MRGIFFLVTLAVVAGATTVSKGAIVFGQLDDFEDGTVMNWVEGFFSPNPPTNVPNGGPSGIGDNYLQNISSGGVAAGSRMVMFNQVQWTGDYLGAGVNRIDADMANLGATPLFMRIAVEGIPGQRYGSANAVALPADGNWYPVSFDLTVAAMSPIGALDSLNVVLSNVSTLRILSAQAGPSWMGDAVAATLGVDNIHATASCDCLSDLNNDGQRDGTDVQGFVTCFMATGSNCACADVDGIPGLTVDDLSTFVADLLAGTECP